MPATITREADERLERFKREVDRVSVEEAVRLALLPNVTVHLGRPGGGRFDAAVSREGDRV